MDPLPPSIENYPPNTSERVKLSILLFATESKKFSEFPCSVLLTGAFALNLKQANGNSGAVFSQISTNSCEQ